MAPTLPKTLEEHIAELCAKAIDTPESPELDEIMNELRTSLHSYTERTRMLVLISKRVA